MLNRSFSSMPFVHCEVSKNCRYASRNDFMYWLSALKDGKSMSPVSVLAVAPFISRCSVCETQAMHVAMHSQDTSIPDCPLGWSSMWSGYSFMMVIISIRSFKFHQWGRSEWHTDNIRRPAREPAPVSRALNQEVLFASVKRSACHQLIGDVSQSAAQTNPLPMRRAIEDRYRTTGN